MLLVLAGSILTFTMVQEATEVEPFDRGTIVLEQKVDASPVELRWDTRVEPLVEQKFRNIVRQAYDYSCGS
ncbi:MAG TPA: peptidase C39, partial [Marinobacter hydrocarbonoclasticus]|nr:peptidase C39 [Marinobacter nauticus]